MRDLASDEGDCSRNEDDCSSSESSDEDGWSSGSQDDAACGCAAAWTAPQPMDAGTYEEILNWMGRDTQRPMNETEFSEPELLLRLDMARNKAVWVGNFREDLWYFMINMNPILATCYSHPLHPITRRERLLVYFFSLVFMWMVSVWASLGDLCTKCDGIDGAPKGDVCLQCNNYLTAMTEFDRHFACTKVDKTCWRYIIDQTGFAELSDETDTYWGNHNTAGEYCCQAFKFKALYVLDAFREFGPLQIDIGPFVYCFLMNCAFSIISFQLMMCGCVQSRSTRCRHIGEAIGYICFASMAASVVFLSRTAVLDVIRHKQVLKTVWNVCCAKLASWLGASIFNFAVFCVLFKIQRPKADNDSLKWLDPPKHVDEADKRNAIAKALNPRFNVQASDYIRYAQTKLRCS